EPKITVDEKTGRKHEYFFKKFLDSAIDKLPGQDAHVRRTADISFPQELTDKLDELSDTAKAFLTAAKKQFFGP
ncbi:MAG TPA: hypothetical protein VI544_02525, partial [Candidatus Nanoarchaeia archaeon]|nr:hypothetical protein [Candidatus Nanoarchaeia archaeon]